MNTFTKTGATSYKHTNPWAAALCPNYDPEMWVLTGNIVTPENQAALAICAQCPIRAYCLSRRNDIKPRSMILGGVAFNDDGKPWHLQPNHHPRR